jgi:hypothetical protein
VMIVDFHIKYILIECSYFSQSTAGRSRVDMTFHNCGHNNKSEKYHRSCDYFTLADSKP